MAADGRRPEAVSADIAMNGWVVRQVIRAAGEILLTAGVVELRPGLTGTHRVIVTGVLVAAKPR